MITLQVPGTPKPKGSLKCIGRRGKVAHVLIEDAGEQLTTWRERVTYAARQAKTTYPKGTPVSVYIDFYIPRPLSHHSTVPPRNKILPRYLEAQPVTRSSGDLDKLTRTILDAITDGGLLDDDSQVVELIVRKYYADNPPGWADIYVDDTLIHD